MQLNPLLGSKVSHCLWARIQMAGVGPALCLVSQLLQAGEFQGQRSLVGYSPWAHREADVTE